MVKLRVRPTASQVIKQDEADGLPRKLRLRSKASKAI
ncbi:hypothetical protein CCACVL1_27209 [Corchorus capsularis]|uniref:Uncharacterized protein n=1 Tax=Corchorus capsularis TaxID=210143 RepID=A0A1R3GBT0_COCAP|nr:hypothetical protein CCACVL1_27209 [Corchorus capsularis]